MALLGGELEIIGEPGIGTSVVARVPIPAAGEDTSRG
jgi:signal transduction histidine kinase